MLASRGPEGRAYSSALNRLLPLRSGPGATTLDAATARWVHRRRPSGGQRSDPRCDDARQLSTGRPVDTSQQSTYFGAL